jgi:hypothetical protein
MPPEESTPSEVYLYIACVEYRHLRENSGDKEAVKAMRLMLRSMAVAVCWKENREEVITEAMIIATEKEFMRRAKEDPPF